MGERNRRSPRRQLGNQLRQEPDAGTPLVRIYGRGREFITIPTPTRVFRERQKSPNAGLPAPLLIFKNSKNFIRQHPFLTLVSVSREFYSKRRTLVEILAFAGQNVEAVALPLRGCKCLSPISEVIVKTALASFCLVALLLVQMQALQSRQPTIYKGLDFTLEYPSGWTAQDSQGFGTVFYPPGGFDGKDLVRGAAAMTVFGAEGSSLDHMFKRHMDRLRRNNKGSRVLSAISACVQDADICRTSTLLSPRTDSGAFDKVEVYFFRLTDANYLAVLTVSPPLASPGEIQELATIVKSIRLGPPEITQPPAPTSIEAASSEPATNPTVAATFGNADVIRLVKAKVPDGVIIYKIRTCNCQLDSSTDAIIQLQQAGVSAAVMQALMNPSEKAPDAGAKPHTHFTRAVLKSGEPDPGSEYYTDKNPYYPKFKGQCTWFAWGRS